MKLDLFFKGMQNRETTASAWLATLLRDRAAFRRALLEQLGVVESSDAEASWEVGVETPLGSGFCDVTLESSTAFVLIENKVSSSAVTPGQFLDYYRGAIAAPDRARKQVVAAYLGPHERTGDGELRTVEQSPEYARRHATHRDQAKALGWTTDLKRVVAASEESGEWFAQAGLDAILTHIDRIAHRRPFEQQRADLVALLRRVAVRIADEGVARGGWGDGVGFESLGSQGQEALYTPNLGITTWLTLAYPETERYELGEIFADGRVHVRASVSFNPSTKIGRQDPVLMEQWRRLIEPRQVAVPGIGLVPARNDAAFELAVAFDGSSEELEDQLVVWGASVLAYLRSLR
jgi:hypothetical protein